MSGTIRINDHQPEPSSTKLSKPKIALLLGFLKGECACPNRAAHKQKITC
jgi:hypothetical protein